MAPTVRRGRRATPATWVAAKLLVGVRGDVPAPAPGTQPPQVMTLPRGRHSEKPAAFAEMIGRMFPTVPKIEMFAGGQRAGWDVWGNEVAAP